MRGVVLLLTVLLLASPSALSQTAGDKLVVPGTRIGNWTVDLAIADLVHRNGPATSIAGSKEWTPNGDLRPREPIFYRWEPLYFAAATEDKQRVEFLTVFSEFGRTSPPDYRTDKGIGFRAAQAEVTKTYGNPTAQPIPGPEWTTLIYNEIGLGFRFQGTQMRNIFVFRPGSGGTIWRL